MADKKLAIAIVLSAYDKMSQVVNNATSKAITKFNQVKKASDAFAKQSFATGREAGAIGLGLAGILALPLKAAADMQKMQISLTTAFNGNEKAAKSAFGTINSFAAKTPYSMEEVLTSFIKLKNNGLDPSENSLRAYGNTASSMGKSLDQMIEAVADASTMEFERLKEFGIKARQQTNTVSFTFQGVTTTVAKNSNAIQNYLLAIGNTKFAGGIDRQSKSVYGQLSTLQDNVKMTAATMGATLIPQLNHLFETIGPVIAQISDWVAKNPELSSTILQVVAGAAALSLTISALAFTFGGLAKAVSLFSSSAIFSAKAIQWLSFAMFKIRYTFINSFLPAITSAITSTWAWTAALLANPITWVVLAITALGVAFYVAYKKSEVFRAGISGLMAAGQLLADVFVGVGKTIIGALTFNPKMFAEGVQQSASAAQKILNGGLKSSFNSAYSVSMAQSKAKKTREANQANTVNYGVKPQQGMFSRLSTATPSPISAIAPARNVNTSTKMELNVNVSGTDASSKQAGDHIADKVSKMFKEFQEKQQRTNYAIG